MKRQLSLLAPILACMFALSFAAAQAQTATPSPDLGWPTVTSEAKPWTRWWWPGSGVDKASLTAQLEKLAAAGIGGVEITPIYGAVGYEDRYIDFLSPQWVEMLEHVGREAKRLNLNVDMATGTGWPFGGPWIDEAHGSHRLVVEDGKIAGRPTGMKVKRAAPGDEGLVLDPYSPDALRLYLARFDKAFADLPEGLVLGQFHDSFEYYEASWTPKLLETFQEMHGYDLNQYAAELVANPNDVTTIDRETLARIKCDYRDTLARLHLDYLRTWVEWCHQHNFLVRNQSHGAPGNLLDLYANADIAETEVFGSTPFPIPGLRRLDDEVRHDQDLPESLVIRMASSAGHVAGHQLASSETLTWLREHWKESPSYMKPEIDRILADGINHIFYHGTVFSPDDAPWPGWLFYASTQFNPNNPLWDDLAELNHYVARVQSVLQNGDPDNDILLYWPVEDVWDDADGLIKQLTVHNVKWLTEASVGKIARKLLDRGYSFDYISDAQILDSTIQYGRLDTPGGHYQTIIVPATRRMPVATLQRLAELAATEGVHVIFEKLPEDVPGFGRLDERRAEFQTALKKIPADAVYADVLAAVRELGVPCEEIAEAGISWIRRRTPAGHDYFFANLTDKKLDRWVTLGVPVSAAVILDPLTGDRGAAPVKATADTTSLGAIYLQLAPGQSLIVRTATAAPQSSEVAAATGRPTEPWVYTKSAGDPVALSGTWKIEFLKGGPDLPAPIETTELKSWTDLGGKETKTFAGTARYTLEFDAPTADGIAGVPADWLLDLGDVRESARVRLNGHDIATAWSLPFQVRLNNTLKPGRNTLELDVTNLAANRIRDMDRRGVKWKIMREINFVNINYQPFNAADWPLQPSGLLGPVTLTPLMSWKP